MKNFPQRLAHPSGTELRLERDRVVVLVDDRPTAAATSDVLSSLGLVSDSEATPFAMGTTTDPKRVLNDGLGQAWARTADGKDFTVPAAADGAIDGVRALGPVYVGVLNGESVELGVRPDVLMVTPAADPDDTADDLERLGVIVDEERSKYLGGELWCTIKDPLSSSSLDVAKDVEAAPSVKAVRLEMMPVYRPHAFVPVDPMYVDQWNVRQIQAGGPGHTGWNDQRGRADIVIAVLDDGVDLAHPDLRISANGINLGTMSGTGQALGNDSHGTACAGCAAAIIGNGEGVAGVAGGCSVLPIAFASWSDTEVAAGIRYAIANGAHVISMSFGWDPWDPAVIDPAIQQAYDAGLVMCVATHNHNRRSITYPATNPLVMACGASDQVDERKSPASPDGESWGSNFGSAMSVVAPGVLIPTTDRLGARGYSNTNYAPAFNGTSSATPQVAGLAALLLSCDDTLSPQRVRELIERNADRVGSTPYSVAPGKPNGSWNENMGYGRINVEAAIHELCKRPSILEGFDIKRFRILEDIVKIPRFLEKVPLEEVKSIRVREVPDFRLPDNLGLPVDVIDDVGQPFINRLDRAPVGDELARSVRRPR